MHLNRCFHTSLDLQTAFPIHTCPSPTLFLTGTLMPYFNPKTAKSHKSLRSRQNRQNASTSRFRPSLMPTPASAKKPPKRPLNEPQTHSLGSTSSATPTATTPTYATVYVRVPLSVKRELCSLASARRIPVNDLVNLFLTRALQHPVVWMAEPEEQVQNRDSWVKRQWQAWRVKMAGWWF